MIRSLGFDGGPTKKNFQQNSHWWLGYGQRSKRLSNLSPEFLPCSSIWQQTKDFHWRNSLRCIFSNLETQIFPNMLAWFGPPTAPQSTQQVRRLKSADFRFHLTRLSCSISKPHLQSCNCNVLNNFVRSMVLGLL